jgi:hypothetical protein
MRRPLILLFAIIVFANCNNNKGWSVADRQKGLKGCMDEAKGSLDEATAKKYCSCVLEKAMQKYKTYAEAENGSEEDGKLLAQGCLKIVQGGNNPDDDNKGKGKGGGIFGGGGDDETGGWTSADKKKFLDECGPSAVNAGVDQQTAKTYCDCTLKKIQKIYKSYNAAMKMTSDELTTIQQECAEGARNNDNN